MATFRCGGGKAGKALPAARRGRRSRVLAFRNDRGPTAIAVNVEGQAPQDASPDEEQPDDAYARQIVPFHPSEAPGTIIIDTGQRYLYLVQPNDRAIR